MQKRNPQITPAEQVLAALCDVFCSPSAANKKGKKTMISFDQLKYSTLVCLCAAALAAFWLILFLLFSSPAHANEDIKIDMQKIAMIESSNNPLAWNKKDDSRGLYQITPIVLKEWNNFHPSKIHTAIGLWDPEICFEIADWYMNKRIPQMLKYFKIADTVENRLIAYNAGIKTLVEKRPIPKITLLYLEKYNRK
jgi:hypothetical protein